MQLRDSAKRGDVLLLAWVHLPGSALRKLVQVPRTHREGALGDQSGS